MTLNALPGPADPEQAARLIEAFAAIGRGEASFAAREAGRLVLASLGGNAPYLADLALREPDIVIGAQKNRPEAVLAAIMTRLRATAVGVPRVIVARELRLAKRRAALTIALADLAGAWRVEQVTAALSDLADASISVALRHLLRGLHDRGTIRLAHPAQPERDSAFAVLGMGKLGARELNYSSDIDLVLLFDPSHHVYRDDAQSAMARLARDFVPLLAERSADGMVFRVDLRLRPDPAATPPVISVVAALTYYESHGRTWERAAFSKARPVAGDLAFGATFLEQIRPFVWRRNLDFAAVGEIHDMKRRIDQRHRDRAGDVLGRDVKLGRGGIREIEFIVQTLELVWGGQDPAVRVAGTLAALDALARAKHLPGLVARELAADYRRLRQLEHRLQMIDDRQTHRLPDDEAGFGRFALFMGEADAARFGASLDALFERVHGHFAGFFDTDGAAEPAFEAGDAGRAPAAFQAAVSRLGFVDVQHLAERLRAWRAGRMPALRTVRARELLDAIVPSLLAALARQPDPDMAFRRFDRMLEGQSAGVPLLSLFAHNQALLGRLAAILGAAAPLAEHLAAHPAALDALLAPVARFNRPTPALRRLLHDGDDLEVTVGVVRRFVRREEFHLSVAALERQIEVDEAGLLRAELAKAALSVLLVRVMADFSRRFGKPRGGRFAVVALGRVGAGEMLPGSDLDLMLIYDHPPHAGPGSGPGSGPGLPGSIYFSRLAHGLVGAITDQGREGAMYALDLRLRPSGNKGPVAVSLAAFGRYHAEQAWTWERLALTRARVLTATRGFKPVVEAAIRAALGRVVPPATIRADTRAMRGRLMRDAPPAHGFDLKHREGGMLELAFIVEALQLIHGPHDALLLRPCTRDALAVLARAGHITGDEARGLIGADHLFRTIQGMMRITGLGEPAADAAPASLAPVLAAAGVADFAALRDAVAGAAALVRAAFLRHIGDPESANEREDDLP